MVKAVQEGMSKAKAARVFSISRTAVHHWTKAVAQGGVEALKAKPQGRPRQSALLGGQAEAVVALMTQQCPDELGLPFCLWTREAVAQLLAERFELSVSVWTVGRYLKQWGLTPQKPLRRADEQDPQAVQRWLEQEYLAICTQAKQDNAVIHWGDEMGVRSDDQAGCSYSLKGQTPVVAATGQRFGCNMISRKFCGGGFPRKTSLTITNRGKLSFKLFKQSFSAEVMLEFLRRLIRCSPQKVFLIVDRHPVHRTKRVAQWLEQHQQQIRLFLLPSYSPQLNPDELLNHDVKANAIGRQRPKTLTQMMDNLRSYLHSTQRYPHIIQNYFREKHVAYAAA